MRFPKVVMVVIFNGSAMLGSLFLTCLSFLIGNQYSSNPLIFILRNCALTWSNKKVHPNFKRNEIENILDQHVRHNANTTISENDNKFSNEYQDELPTVPPITFNQDFKSYDP